MAAPFFCTPALLHADLGTLGYDVVEASSLEPSGEARLRLLHWLATDIDAPCAPDDPDDAPSLAAFWDARGVHTATRPNAYGHYVPLTASDRPRDRTAALVFLRAAIDLALAFRRVRAAVHRQPKQSDRGGGEQEAKRDRRKEAEFDRTALSQLDALIRNRHALFTTRLVGNDLTAAKAPRLAPSPSLSAATAKPKRPLQPRNLNVNVNVNANANVKACAAHVIVASPKASPPPPARPLTAAERSAAAKLRRERQSHAHAVAQQTPVKKEPALASRTFSAGSPTTKSRKPPRGLVPSRSSGSLPKRQKKGASTTATVAAVAPRDAVVDALRVLRRETGELEARLPRDFDFDADDEMMEEEEKEEEEEDVEQVVSTLAAQVDAVSALAESFARAAADGRAVRIANGRQPTRVDAAQQAAVARVVPACAAHARAIESLAHSLGAARDAAAALRQHGERADQFVDSHLAAALDKQQRRTARHV